MNREVYRHPSYDEEITEEKNEEVKEDFHRPEDLSKSDKSVEDRNEDLSEGDDKDEVDDCEETTFNDVKTYYPEDRPEDRPEDLLEDLPETEEEKLELHTEQENLLEGVYEGELEEARRRY